MSKKKVVHISESFGGGVAYIIQKIVESSIDKVEHTLLINERDSIGNLNILEQLGCKVIRFKNSTFSRLVQIRKLGKSDFDIIHAHSSFAGALSRLALPLNGSILYTPHCFSFERKDLNKIYRSFFYVAEQLLSLLGGNYIACGEREFELCSKMIGLRSINLLRNVANVECANTGKKFNFDTNKRIIAAAGRISPQKGIDFFLEFKNYCQNKNQANDVLFAWIGGGIPEIEKKLTDNGIIVTGFLNRSDCLASLTQAKLYLHVAEWEGYPVQLIEAAALGIPALVRKIPATQSIEGLVLAKDAYEMSCQANLDNNIGFTNSATINKLNSLELFKKQLSQCYSLGL